MRQQYVITAGKNRCDRQLYVSSYNDSPDDWSISIVPYITSKTRCYELLAKVKRDIKAREKNSAIKNLKQEITFEIIEWNG